MTLYWSTLPLHWEGVKVQMTVLYKMTCLYTDNAFHLSSEVWISCFFAQYYNAQLIHLLTIHIYIMICLI